MATKTQRCVTLHKHGYSYEDIADITNNKQSNVASLVIRGKPKGHKKGKKIVRYVDMPKEDQTILKEDKDAILKKEKELFSVGTTPIYGLDGNKIETKNNKENKQPAKTKPVTKVRKTKTGKNKVNINLEDVETNEKVGSKTKKQIGTRPITKLESAKNVNIDKVKKTTIEPIDHLHKMIGENTKNKPLVGENNLKNRKPIRPMNDTETRRLKQYSLDVASNAFGENKKCSLCNGKGWILQKTDKGLEKVICTVCQGLSKEITHRQKMKYDKEDLLNKYVRSEEYRQESFDINEFKTKIDFPEEYRGRSFDKYCTFMELTLAGLEEYTLPNKSYYVVAPDGFGKKWFAYEIIKQLIDKGYKTTGMLNAGIIGEYIDRNMYTELDKMLDADIILVNLSSLRKTYLTHTIQYLTEEADRRGVPLFVFSRVDAKTLIKNGNNWDVAKFLTIQSKDWVYGELEQVGIVGEEYTKAVRYMQMKKEHELGVSKRR